MERQNLKNFLQDRNNNLLVSYENVDIYSINGNISTTLLKSIIKVSGERLERISHSDKKVLFLGLGNRHFGARMKNGYINPVQMLIGINLFGIRRVSIKPNFFIYDYENDAILSISELCGNITNEVIDDFDNYMLKSRYSIKTNQNKSEMKKEFSVHTPNLLNEILQNNTTGIFKIPLVSLSNLLERVSQRASELNDPVLNNLMCKLTLYSIADPQSDDYDLEKIREIEKLSFDFIEQENHAK